MKQILTNFIHKNLLKKKLWNYLTEDPPNYSLAKIEEWGVNVICMRLKFHNYHKGKLL